MSRFREQWIPAFAGMTTKKLDHRVLAIRPKRSFYLNALKLFCISYQECHGYSEK
ncbi:Uncharacterized protein dnm_042360 [Desulfonema magnum]|uniref:Uncharacterized protein n=1 Tax=Desulfonema magnum TaxID=45655 RepID=A0A975BNK1_9BACT|nr:Uncharacterized protein dnm_042360 [Desulfonema magnum]